MSGTSGGAPGGTHDTTSFNEEWVQNFQSQVIAKFNQDREDAGAKPLLVKFQAYQPASSSSGGGQLDPEYDLFSGGMSYAAALRTSYSTMLGEAVKTFQGFATYLGDISNALQDAITVSGDMEQQNVQAIDLFGSYVTNALKDLPGGTYGGSSTTTPTVPSTTTTTSSTTDPSSTA